MKERKNQSCLDEMINTQVSETKTRTGGGNVSPEGNCRLESGTGNISYSLEPAADLLGTPLMERSLDKTLEVGQFLSA